MATKRGYPDAPHLFPPRQFGDYTLSLQADGRITCTPSTDGLNELEAYHAVEAALYGPDGLIHPASIGAPDEVCTFWGSAPDDESAVPIGAQVPWNAVELLEDHLRTLMQPKP